MPRSSRSSLSCSLGGRYPRRVPGRPGDIAVAYAGVSVAHELLGWEAERIFADACADLWWWQSHDPDGDR